MLLTRLAQSRVHYSYNLTVVRALQGEAHVPSPKGETSGVVSESKLEEGNYGKADAQVRYE